MEHIVISYYLEVIDKEIIFFIGKFLENNTTNSNIQSSITIEKHTTFSLFICDDRTIHIIIS